MLGFGLIALLICTIAVYSIYQNLTYEFKFESGELREELTSPDGDYTAQVFLQLYGGAAGGVNVYVNVIFHSEGHIVRAVYYSDAKSYLHVNWVDRDRLSITNTGGGENRSIVLTVGKEIYDETGRACRAYSIQKNYTCYSKKNSIPS